jgi:hypothetical protein
MATTTVGGHVSRALEFFERPDTYVGIGKSTPWEDENVPPNPIQTKTTLDEVIGYKKVEYKYLVVEDIVDGTISYRDSKWRIVPPDQAVAQGARWVYVEAHLRYDELPLVSYRQVGIFNRLVKLSNIDAGKVALLPSEVEDVGVLEVYDNRKVVNRQSDQKEQLSFVIEF